MRLMVHNRSDCGSVAVANPSSGRDKSFCATARTIRGVTSTISSVWLLTKSRLRNNDPSTGNCANPGSPLIAILVCSAIRPAIAIEPPDGISRVVSARRVLIDGIVTEFTVEAVTDCDRVIELSLDSSDTSVITRRLIRPSLRTTGVKFSEMPNFLKLIWVVHTWVTGSQEYPAGTGNSPPAIKVADSPEIAVRLGSASVRTTPALSMARTVACTEGTPAIDEVPKPELSELPVRVRP